MIEVKIRVKYEFTPGLIAELFSDALEIFFETKVVNVVFNSPGKGPVVGIAMLTGKEFEDDNRQSFIVL